MHAPPTLLQLRDAVRRNPADFIAWVMLSDAELNAGDSRAGELAARQALRLRPEHPEALARLGRAHWMQQRYQEAAEILRRASSQAPRHPGIALWLGHALEDAGEAEAAALAYQQAHSLMPEEPYIAAQLLNWRRKLCDWRDLERLSEQVRKAVSSGRGAIEPFAFLNEEASANEQLMCARTRAHAIARSIPPTSPLMHKPDANGAIRIGFLSNGFGAHPTGLLTVAFFEALRRCSDAPQIHLFALNRNDQSDIRMRLERAAHALHDLSSLPHTEMAQRIRDTDLDILFDLRGWGGGGVPEVLAMRPAPIQVNWLAYPGTSGAPWIDYILADAFVLPEQLASGFSESVIRLPGCFQPSDTTRVIAAPSSRRDCGLPENGVVFCCFNNSYKLNPRGFSAMMSILRQVPESVLWLLSGPGAADQRLRAAAAQAGTAPDRLVFMSKLPHSDYLARYRHADLFLDTVPYNAHTTASDALWAGCPVLTRPGGTFASRVAGSLNHHLDLDHMNADDEATYIRIAVELGSDPAALRQLRQTLDYRKKTASLFDMDGFTRGFIGAATGMLARPVTPRLR
ncbi:MAG: tetratricopeptide repeat protein [Xanthomonadaceae bacterium]|jgi:predicted O-linked N-acetylglucosamine transferase (SPINDLY family)|nr:tetratricopeptide repeat protein [Xanthomonadaceae bacterium]